MDTTRTLLFRMWAFNDCRGRLVELIVAVEASEDLVALVMDAVVVLLWNTLIFVHHSEVSALIDYNQTLMNAF